MQRYTQAPTNISQYAGSVGCLIDRCLKHDGTIGTAWMIDHDKVATCAHLVILYSDCLTALKVRFPAAGLERSIQSVAYHPKFNVKQADQMARKALTGAVPALPLQEHNLAVLTLGGGLTDLSSELTASINERLSSPAPPRDKGLGGSLADIDLPLVIQTITNARKEGILILSDERNRALAKLFCRDGKIVYATYGPLANEVAIYQIVNQHLTGNFYFNSRREPDWPVQTAIGRPTDMLLIESHRRLDEIPKLLLELGGDTTIYQRAANAPNYGVLPPDIKRDVEAIWPYLDGSTPIGQIWRLALLDDYAVFLTLSELLKANHIQEVQSYTPSSSSNLLPLSMAPELPLTPFDDIQNLIVDPVAGQPLISSGHLLGSLRPGDPWHLLHNLSLPLDAAGCPLFKEGKVIGMHCGTLPASPNATSGASSLNQLLWVESVYECLDQNGTGSSTQTSSIPTRMLPAGCTEVARIDCPRCGASSLDSAKFCKLCGTALIQDLEFRAPGGDKKVLFILAGLILILALAGGGYWYAINSHPADKPPVATPALEARLEAGILRADQKNAKWQLVPAGTHFHNGELLSLQIKLSRDSFLYILHRGTNPTDIDLLFPDSASADIRYPKGETITYPRENTIKTPHGTALSGLTVTGAPGAEDLIFLSSETPCNLFTAPATIAKVYEKAAAALSSTTGAKGVELPASAFGEEVFPKTSTLEASSNVYITRLELAHSD
jgi:hypothetical protein